MTATAPEDIKTGLAAYARRVKGHDWTADFSDDYSVTRRASARKAELARLAETSSNHTRVWELGSGHHGNFTWEAVEGVMDEDNALIGRPGRGRTRADVHETAWRWVGTYLWVHGIKVDEDEAKAFVGAADGHRDWYDRRLSTAKDIDWKAVEALVKRGQ